MDSGTRRQLRQMAIVIAAGGLAGVAYLPVIEDDMTVSLALRFALQGMLITLFVFGFEIFVGRTHLSERLRRAPAALAIAAKTLVTTALIVAAYGIGGLLLFQDRFGAPASVYELLRDTLFALAVSAVLQFLLLVRDIVGPRVLTNILLGRYHQPLSEERLFLLLDVTGSTALAERVGPVGAYAMISRFFFDVAQETIRFGGETQSYIGDAVLVSWPLARGVQDARCLACVFAIQDRIAARAGDYRRRFGRAPAFRAGLHGGRVVAGECGDDKRQIVYFGDAINTTARIQEACKTLQQPLLISGELLQRMTLPPAYRARDLGPHRLRGRAEDTELFTVERG